MNFEALKQFVIGKLSNELNKDLTYHCVEHTMDVLESVDRLGKMEGILNDDICLLKTAALFHDLGFVDVYDGHEEASIVLASNTLPAYGYSAKSIEIISNLIRATKIPQSPQNHLEEILADADLDYLGRDDLFIIGQRLQYEWKKYGKISTLREWHEKQLAFIKNHKYFTKSAIKLRENKKQENIGELELLLCVKK